MPDINSAVPGDLPSTGRLVRSTVIAAFIASVLLVTVVLPAEYGVDPTGAGRVLGLTEMGAIKVALAREAQLGDDAEAHAASAPAAALPATTASASPEPALAGSEPAAAAIKSREASLLLRPGEGKEIKLIMRQGTRVKYSWSTDRGAVNYDMHADSVNPRRRYHGYAKGTAVSSDQGELVAAFDGSHGWFWRNRTNEEVTLTLRAEGEYAEMNEPK